MGSEIATPGQVGSPIYVGYSYGHYIQNGLLIDSHKVVLVFGTRHCMTKVPILHFGMEAVFAVVLSPSFTHSILFTCRNKCAV